MPRAQRQQLTWLFVTSALALSVALVFLRLQLPAWQLLPDEMHATLSTWHSKASERMFSLSLNDRQTALLSAMLLGQRNHMTWEIRGLYAQAGASHLLALSGLHLSILLVLFQFLLRQVLHNRLWRAVLTLILLTLLWAYTLLTGCSPSLLRAAIMTSLWMLTQMSGESGKTWHSFCMAACIILFFDPQALHSLSFQLSFAAVAGILLFYMPLCRQISAPRQPMKWLWQGWCVSTSALIGSAPLAVYYFHTFSVSGFLLSPLYILLATGILYGGLFLLLTGQGTNLVGWLMDVQHTIMQWATSIPGSTTENLHPTPWQVMFIYLGFVLTLPVLNALQPRTLDFASFRIRRALRQWPYFVAAATCMLTAWLMP